MKKTDRTLVFCALFILISMVFLAGCKKSGDPETLPGTITAEEKAPETTETGSESPAEEANITLLNGLSSEVPTAVIRSGSGEDKASWEKQTPEDYAHIEPGAEFDVTWFLRNTGTTTWTTDYCCRYFTNTDMTKRPGQRYYIPHEVAPNEVGGCTVDAIAPTKPGTYKMVCVLSNAEDKNFYTVDITIIVD